MALPEEVLQDLLLKIFDEDAQLSANEIKVIFDNKSQFKGITEIDEDDSLFAAVSGALSIVSPIFLAAASYFVSNVVENAYDVFIGKFADQTIKLIKSNGLNQAYLEDLISPNKSDLFIENFSLPFWNRDDNFFDEMIAALIANPNNLDNIPYLLTPTTFDVKAAELLRTKLDSTGILVDDIPYAELKGANYALVSSDDIINFGILGTIPDGVFNSIANSEEQVANLRLKSITFSSAFIGIDIQTSNLQSIDAEMFRSIYGDYLSEAVKTGSNFEKIETDYIDIAAIKLGDKFATDFETDRRKELWSNLLDANALGSAGITPEELAQALQDANTEALDGAEATGQIGSINDSDGLSEADIAKRQRFFQQCCLMVLMNDLKTGFEEEIELEASSETPEWHHPNSVYNERFYMVNDTDNSRFVNTLIAPKGQQIRDFMDITPDVQAFLVPKIRLYKVYGNSENLRQVEFIFRNNTIPDNPLNSLFNENDSILRGNGYGIKEFSFSYEGASPATAKNDIKVNLKLYFQDFKDFITKFKTIDSQGNEDIISFVELLFFDQKDSDNRTPQIREQYDPTYYRIRADVGWQVPDSNDQQFAAVCNKRGLSAARIKNAIIKMNKSFYLTMVDHTLDFAKDGTVSITGDYIAYIEAELKNSKYDALINNEIASERKRREDELIKAKRDCTPGEVAALKRVYNAREKQDIKNSHKRIMNRLYSSQKVFNLHITSDGGFRSKGFFERMPTYMNGNVGVAQTPTTEEAASETTTGVEEGSIPKRFNADDPENNVQFFYLGDLLYIIMDSIFEQPSDPVKFIMPSIDIEGYLNDSGSFSINVAKIPISVLYFKEWFTNTIIKPERKSYAVMYFIRDLLNNLVVDALIETCLNRDYDKSFRFDTTSATSNGDKLSGKAAPSAEVIQLANYNNIFPLTAESDTGEPVDISSLLTYVIIMPSYNTISNNGRGIYDEDIDKGIYHFEIGVDRGLMNDVKFTKTDMAYIREARMEQQSGVDGLLQLAAVYKATLNMFGNTLFYPGMMLYINPFGLGGNDFIPNKPNSIANKMGLGGYHLVTRVNSTISNGSFKTTIEALFEYPGDGKSRSVSQGRADEAAGGAVEEPNPDRTEEQIEYCDNILRTETDALRSLLGSTGGISNGIENPAPREASVASNSVTIPLSTPDPNSSQTNSSTVVTDEGVVSYNSTQNQDDLYILYIDSNGTTVAMQELDDNGSPTGPVMAS